MSFISEYTSAVAGIPKFVKLLKYKSLNKDFIANNDEYDELKKIINDVYLNYNIDEKHCELGWIKISTFTIKYMIKNNFDNNHILILNRINEIILSKYNNNNINNNDDNNDYGDIKVINT